MTPNTERGPLLAGSSASASLALGAGGMGEPLSTRELVYNAIRASNGALDEHDLRRLTGRSWLDICDAIRALLRDRSIECVLVARGTDLGDHYGYLVGPMCVGGRAEWTG